jgi:hypothetical protein
MRRRPTLRVQLTDAMQACPLIAYLAQANNNNPSRSPCRAWHWTEKLFNFRECDVGKYFIGWLFGVPVFVLVLIYLFMH